MDFTSDKHLQMIQAYNRFWKALGSDHSKDLGVYSLHAYVSNRVLWAIDLTPDLGCEEGHLHPITTGNIELDFEWKTALAQPINIVVYSESDKMIQMDWMRQVIVDS